MSGDTCEACKWWERVALRYAWELERAARGDTATVERTHWGICGYTRQPSALMLTDYSDVETRENFGCGMFTAKEH
mgnify:CR=1 FL=1